MEVNDTADRSSWQPVRLGVAGGIETAIAALVREHPELAIADQYERNLEEHFLLRNPKYRFDKNYRVH